MKKMKKSKRPEQSNEEIKRVGGFLLIFILTFLINIYTYIPDTISSIYSIILNLEIIFSFKLWLIILNALISTSIIIFTIYTIFSLIRLKPNTISLAKMTLVLIIISNSLFAIFSTSFSDQMGSILISLTWLLYFNFSKRVKNTFPPEKRKVYTVDKIIFFIAVIILIASYIPDFLQSTSPDSKVMNINESIISKRPLAENEYFNGVIYFKKPRDIDIKEHSEEPFHSFILSNDKMSILIVSDITSESPEEYIDILHKTLYNNMYDHFRQKFQPRYTLISEDKGINLHGFKYVKKTTKIELEGGEIGFFSLIVISDNKTNKIAGVRYFVPQDQEEIYSSYLEEVTDSITFS
ncbi:MAG: hypothetical protein A2729_03480 [Candidatus Buchananbacteria bacterium RIFCSPHIGHO2_01_FULL_39_14]|uniref:Uncharacterized protein n=1 Tax=Candidatus Buchananbacteria bacterium RIFCSPHIGHO2_01_FULL_39_14 TaxID=1797532 RepID=A0A1G1XU73_9BACT|nr:MAG: hypothetical protein A2729_03480 [Candidatus Buchananbacteria bacterium RIFCSPHIGHO2_01_FULL_39_14]